MVAAVRRLDIRSHDVGIIDCHAVAEAYRHGAAFERFDGHPIRQVALGNGAGNHVIGQYPREGLAVLLRPQRIQRAFREGEERVVRGAKTVNGPSACRVSTKPVAPTSSTSVEN